MSAATRRTTERLADSLKDEVDQALTAIRGPKRRAEVARDLCDYIQRWYVDYREVHT